MLEIFAFKGPENFLLFKLINIAKKLNFGEISFYFRASFWDLKGL